MNTEAEQQEDTASIRLDHQFSSGFSAYVRYMFSEGEVDTPDRTVTPRRVLAKQSPKNLVANFQNIFSGNVVNEFKVGWNGPKTSALAFGPAGYDPTGVSLSGNFTSSSIDARGTTGIARSGLLIRATSASTTVGSDFDPMSLAFSNATTWTAGAHTFKFGGEYRRIQSDFQFLGSNELSYNSINDFIDNRLNQVAVTLDSPVFQPQQFYAIGFLQDSWRLNDRLTLELGLRYDYYSVVEEADDRAKPFFVEENEFGDVGNGFYNADKNNFSPRLAAAYQLNELTALRAGFGLFYGPGQFEDRIQPIENFITRSRVQASDVPNNGLQYPVPPSQLRDLLSIRGYTHDYPNEYNMQYGASLSRELPGDINLTIGYTGSQGKDMFLRGVGNVLDPVTRAAPGAQLRPDRLQDGRLRRRPRPRRGLPDDRLRHGARTTPCSSACRAASAPASAAASTISISRNRGTTQGSNEAAHGAEHLRLRDRGRHQPAGHPAHLQRLADLRAALRRALGGRLARRHDRQRPQRRAAQRHHRPRRQRDGERRDGDQHSRRQQPRHAASGSRPRRGPVHRQRRRALAQPGRVHDAAARHVRQPAPQLPAWTGRSGRPTWWSRRTSASPAPRASRCGSRCSTSPTG